MAEVFTSRKVLEERPPVQERRSSGVMSGCLGEAKRTHSNSVKNLCNFGRAKASLTYGKRLAFYFNHEELR